MWIHTKYSNRCTKQIHVYIIHIYIIQCAARITRHRAIVLFICILTFWFSKFFQYRGQEILKSRVQKNEWFAASGKVHGENHCRQFLQAVIFAVNFTWYFPCSFTQNHDFLLFSWPGGAFWRLGSSFWRPGGSFWRPGSSFWKPGAPFWRFLKLLSFLEHSGHEKVVPFWDNF